ncbi:MAG: alpha-amylase [Oscillospiraceae bacterium]|nr:alpha-amylase [Oscillospiraceae bacterium]
MAADTDLKLQTQVIYSIYVRAHTPEGTFRAVIPDLDRIAALGVDMIWFLPIHPIGVEKKKGSLGCPYANRDYRSVNPEYGSMEDFQALVDAIHAHGMKVMIDVVYNHTSPDSVLFETHPEFFWQDAEGKPGNRVGDWSDVIDLDYRVAELWDYQLETLRMWAGIVDGFRCDVASLLPLAFWKRARAAVQEVHPGFVWLAETTHRAFYADCRARGIQVAHDAELFEAFDIEYEYDIRDSFDRFLQGNAPLSHYLDDLALQDAVYPETYNKLRFLENHDQPRIASRIPEESDLENYTAMLYFLKGTTLLYAGQEFMDNRQPSLFEREPIHRGTGHDLSPLMRKLAQIKREILRPDDVFFGRADDDYDIASLKRVNAEATTFGVFSLCSLKNPVPVDAPDGTYENLIDGSPVKVKDGTLLCQRKPIIFTVSARAMQAKEQKQEAAPENPMLQFLRPFQGESFKPENFIPEGFKPGNLIPEGFKPENFLPEGFKPENFAAGWQSFLPKKK